jgi:hypothetical protein
MGGVGTAGVELGVVRVGAPVPRSRGRPTIQGVRQGGSGAGWGTLERRPRRAVPHGRESVAAPDEGSPRSARRHDGMDAAAVSRSHLSPAHLESGRRLGRLSSPAQRGTKSRRSVEPVRGADGQAARRAAHVLPLGPGYPHRGAVHRAPPGPSSAPAGGAALSRARRGVDVLPARGALGRSRW